MPIDLESPTPVWVKAMPVAELQPDHWYLGWRCNACRHVAAIEHDPTCGALRIQLQGRAVVCFRCRNCQSVEIQTPAQSVQYHREPGWGRGDRVVANGESCGLNTLPGRADRIAG